MQDELFDLALSLNSAKKPYFTASIFNKEWVDIKIWFFICELSEQKDRGRFFEWNETFAKLYSLNNALIL